MYPMKLYVENGGKQCYSRESPSSQDGVVLAMAYSSLKFEVGSGKPFSSSMETHLKTLGLRGQTASQGCKGSVEALHSYRGIHLATENIIRGNQCTVCFGISYIIMRDCTTCEYISISLLGIIQ
jgi:hypothetical protein